MKSARFGSYKEILDFMFEQLPMYQYQGPRALKYDLNNIIACLNELGNPHQSFRSIHIAGTNGKGTTAHLIAAAFQANGWKTGLYTSPHYRDFRERIKIEGAWIPEEFMLLFFNEHIHWIETLKPSYFELSVALAFAYFAEESVDIAVIEVGLGGRLDSTNVILPLLSVITNISYDHVQTLGNTLAEIAGEKAGIIKPGIPVVIGETHPETAPVFSRIASDRNAPLFFSENMPQIETLVSQIHGGPSGPFRMQNLRYALTGIRIFNQYYPDLALEQSRTIFGMENVRALTNYIGRWEILGTDPLIIADGAHNVDSWRKSLDYLDTLRFDQLHLVIGFVADKSYEEILNLLPTDAICYFCRADIPRALDPEKLQHIALKFGLKGDWFPSTKDALAAAKTAAGKQDLILVGGSIFIVGEVI